MILALSSADLTRLMVKSRQKGLGQVSKAGGNVVVRVQTVNAQGKKKKRARDVVSHSPGAGGAERYQMALLNPFSTDALGVRVPDQFSAPTATLSLREFVSIGNDVVGNADCIFMPNVLNPAFSTRSSVINGTVVPMPDGTNFRGLINTGASLYGKITNYRIVSWGLRIRNTTAVTACQGVLTVALVNPHTRMRVPATANIGGQAAGATGSLGFNIENWCIAMGIPYVGATTGARVDTSALLDFPAHARYQALQLAERTVEVHPKLTDPAGLAFRDSNDSVWGSDMQATSSAVYVQPGDASYLMLDGWTSVVIGFTGGSSVANTQTFDVELIYHLEGSPNVAAATAFIADTPQSPTAPLAMMMAQAALAKLTPFSEAATAAMAAYRALAR